MLGPKIRQVRASRRLTESDLAVKVGIGIAELQKYEKGEAEPNTALLGKIAEALDVTVGDLRGG